MDPGRSPILVADLEGTFQRLGGVKVKEPRANFHHIPGLCVADPQSGNYGYNRHKDVQ